MRTASRPRSSVADGDWLKGQDADAYAPDAGIMRIEWTTGHKQRGFECRVDLSLNELITCAATLCGQSQWKLIAHIAKDMDEQRLAAIEEARRHADPK